MFLVILMILVQVIYPAIESYYNSEFLSTLIVS